MKNPFSHYPPVIFHLILLVFLITGGLEYVGQLPFQGNYPNDAPISPMNLNTLILLSSGLAYLIGGYLVDRIKDVKEGLKWGAFAALIGFLLALVPNQWLSLTGIFLANLGVAILFIFVVLHIAVLFPVATDMKDNAFMLLQVAPYFLAILYIFSNFIYLFLGEWFSVVIPLFFFVGCVALVFYSKEIGYSVDEEENEKEEERLPWEILFGLTAFSIIIKLAVNHFQNIGIGGYGFFGFITPGFITYFSVILLIPLAVIVWVAMRMAEYRPRQINKAILGVLLLIVVFILEFVVRGTDSWELNQITDYFAIFIEQLIFLPIFFSIITHINYSEKAGLWLGILLGVPILVVQLIALVLPVGINPLVMPGIAAFLLIAAFIFLRENRVFISELLKLEESSQEEDELPPSDPMEHLVGK